MNVSPAPTVSPENLPASGSVQDQIAAMVCELLTLPSIDPTDNIFLVGGHSMLAMQLVARIKKVLGVRLTLRQVFEQPSVEGITATVVARSTPAAVRP